MAKRKAAITEEEAKSRGAFLRRFREQRLGVDQEILARLSDGWLTREEISNVERGKTLWQSPKQANGYAAILKLSPTELQEFLAKRMSENDVLAKAWPRIRLAKTRTESEIAKERELDARARSGLATAGLSEVELAASLIPALRAVVAKNPSITDSALAETATDLHATIARGERAKSEKGERSGRAHGDDRTSGSHPIETQPPHRRR